MTSHNRDVSGLLKFAKEKNKKTLVHVEQVLKQMLEAQHIITFSHVAKQAQVSRSWLYKNARVREKIETIRQQQSEKMPSSTTPQPQRKQENIVENLKERIKKLQQENTKLHEQLEAIYGRMIE